MHRWHILPGWRIGTTWAVTRHERRCRGRISCVVDRQVHVGACWAITAIVRFAEPLEPLRPAGVEVRVHEHSPRHVAVLIELRIIQADPSWHRCALQGGKRRGGGRARDLRHEQSGMLRIDGLVLLVPQILAGHQSPRGLPIRPRHRHQLVWAFVSRLG